MRMARLACSAMLSSMRCLRSASVNSSRRGARFAVLLIAVMAGVSACSPVAEAGAPIAYRRSLRQIDTQLRLAIESRPGELAEYMRSSEIICGVAERSQARGDREGAESGWRTLSQAVQELDYPASHAVDVAYADADASLVALKKRFSARWQSQPPKLRDLRLGVAQTRRGIASLRSAMGAIRAAFAFWDERQCATANQGIEAGVRRLSPGVDRVNLGMARLLHLAVG